MLRYFARRVLWACVLFVAVTLVTFVIFFVIPTDPARQVCGQRATATCIERARHFLGLDKPMISIPVGILSALRPGSLLDRFT